jgi:predicted nucleic acid-binding protein
MLLLDTSVWIDRLADRRTEAVNFALRRESTEGLALTEMVYLEVMQGVRTEANESAIRAILAEQQILLPTPGLETFEQAAALYRAARRKGFTIRTAVDCLVAQIALEHDALLVHNDRDFFALAQVAPQLQLFPSPRFH